MCLLRKIQNRKYCFSQPKNKKIEKQFNKSQYYFFHKLNVKCQKDFQFQANFFPKEGWMQEYIRFVIWLGSKMFTKSLMFIGGTLGGWSDNGGDILVSELFIADYAIWRWELVRRGKLLRMWPGKVYSYFWLYPSLSIFWLL